MNDSNIYDLSEYGIWCFDNDGNVTDYNLDSSLVVEGVLILGNQRAGWLGVDQLFPLRTQFRGVFLLPLFHGITAQVGHEYCSQIYWDRGKICWQTINRSNLFNVPWLGGAFSGRQLLYGYYN